MNLQMKNETTISQQRIRELEHHIQMREKELYDIKEAYHEKIKKCESWENVTLIIIMNNNNNNNNNKY